MFPLGTNLKDWIFLTTFSLNAFLKLYSSRNNAYCWQVHLWIFYSNFRNLQDHGLTMKLTDCIHLRYNKINTIITILYRNNKNKFKHTNSIEKIWRHLHNYRWSNKCEDITLNVLKSFKHFLLERFLYSFKRLPLLLPRQIHLPPRRWHPGTEGKRG